MVAQRFAITYPSRVRSLIAPGSSVLPVPPDAFEGAERDRIMAAQEDPWQREGLTPGHVRFEAFVAVSADIRRSEAMPGHLRRLENARFGVEWLRQLQAGTPLTPRLPEAAHRTAELAIPVLLPHGRCDMTFSVSAVRLVDPTLGLIPRARAVVLENAGHMLHVGDPEG